MLFLKVSLQNGQYSFIRMHLIHLVLDVPEVAMIIAWKDHGVVDHHVDLSLELVDVGRTVLTDGV